MDQPCYKCGQSVEEGIPFCPHCSAPQIRVVVTEPSVPAVLATEPSVGISSSQPGATVVLPVAWSAAFRPCALAALVAAILMGAGLYPLISMISVGFLAVVFYRQRWPGSTIKPAAGVRLGALGGLLLFAISAVLGTIIAFFLHKGPEIRAWLVQAIDQAAKRTSDPQTLATFEWFKTADGLEVFTLLILVFFFLFAIGFGVLGGALGATLLGRNNRR